MGDEGAANHTRFCAEHGELGLNFFVFGRSATNPSLAAPPHFPARQSLEASQAIARCHGLRPQATLFAQQSPSTIDAGAFHNDVVAVGHRHVHLFHEDAFAGGAPMAARLAEAVGGVIGRPLLSIPVPAAQVSLEDAIRSYVFNSQLVTLPLPSGEMALIAPLDCLRVPAVKAFLDELVGSGGTPIRRVFTFDLGERMRNGGGPACLRLRVVLTDTEVASMAPGVLLTDAKHDVLKAWILRHYRDRLTFDDLSDPQLLDESRSALDELTSILGLGTLYAFQHG